MSDVLPADFTPDTVFAPGGVEAALAKVAGEAKAVRHDVSTVSGRKLIAAAAYQVARIKVTLDEMGKALTDEWRARTNAVNAERRVIRERLDALADEIRQPLTDWENAEKTRISDHDAAIDAILALAILPFDATSDDIADRLDKLNLGSNRDWQEFKDRASNARAEAFDKLTSAMASAKAREERDAELARLRAAEIKRAAAADRAERDRLAGLEAERARLAQANAAEKAEEARRFAAVEAERDRLAQAEAAANERATALETAEASARQRVADLEEEAVRQKSAEEAAKADEARRAASRTHRAKINNSAVASLIAAGLAEDVARIAVTAIARGDVANVSIRY